MTIAIFDCDGVLVDSSHRYRNKPCGSIDLEYWRENSTPDKVAKDRLLPMVRTYKTMLADPRYTVIIATARQCTTVDFSFFKEKLGMPHRIIYRRTGQTAPDWRIKFQGLFPIVAGRDRRALMFEDNAVTIHELQKRLPNIRYLYIPSKQGVKNVKA
jgi:phosphoglycolate phosphatase-like HAD superfamily hydrolase